MGLWKLGHKRKKALDLKEKGFSIQIVKENDFFQRL
jgi:hypothetical protein